MNKTLMQTKEKFQLLALKAQQLPLVVAGKQWFSRQSLRDQRIIKALAGFVIACLIIALFIQPFYSKQSAHQAKLDKSIAIYEQLATNAHKFRGKARSSGNTPILALITQQAKIAKVNLKRFEPDDANLRIWLDDESFDHVARWLETLTRDHGIKVKQISIERGDKVGRIDLRATLYK
jgi:type II secretory pathway component PulM